MKVKFTGVGRNKRSWEAATSKLDYTWLLNQVKRKGGLLSSNIEFDYLEATGKGAIYAGWRVVGTFEATPDPLPLFDTTGN